MRYHILGKFIVGRIDGEFVIHSQKIRVFCIRFKLVVNRSQRFQNFVDRVDVAIVGY